MSDSSSTMAAVFPIMTGITAEVAAIYWSIVEVSRPLLSLNLYSWPNTTFTTHPVFSGTSFL